MDDERAHDNSRYNREELSKSERCGCFCCKKIYHPSEIIEWIDKPEGKAITALCPYCGIDSVIGSASGFPINDEFLQKMYEHWFGSGNRGADVKPVPDKTLVELLTRGVDAWNAWRSQHLEAVIQLQGASLAGSNLRGADLHGALLKKADLRGADLSYANLRKANLELVNGCDAHFEHANLNRANCYRASLARAHLLSANLSYAELRSAGLMHVDFTEADLRHADLSTSNLFEARFNHADCYNANFFAASLDQADLTSANLMNADFTQARLRQAQLTHAELSCSRLVMTDMAGAVLRHCSVSGIFILDIQSQAMLQRDLAFAYPDPRSDSSTIATDDIMYAYILSVLIANKQYNSIVRNITVKSVLLMESRLTEGEQIDAIKDTLHDGGYMPIVFHDQMPNRERAKELSVQIGTFVQGVILDLMNLHQTLQILNEMLPQLDVPILLLYHTSITEVEVLEELSRKYPQKLSLCGYRTTTALLTGVQEFLEKRVN